MSLLSSATYDRRDLIHILARHVVMNFTRRFSHTYKVRARTFTQI